jgi:hypothetical protein
MKTNNPSKVRGYLVYKTRMLLGSLTVIKYIQIHYFCCPRRGSPPKADAGFIYFIGGVAQAVRAQDS